MEKAASRFWAKVQVGADEACWEWTATKLKSGRGQFNHNGKLVFAHRFAWTLANGEIPDGLVVCHKCDNPGCVNPKHLFVGTQRDNILDMVAKGRGRKHDWTKHNSAKLTPTDVIAIRNAADAGEPTKSIARRYMMDKMAIKKIIRRQTWKHVGSDCHG